MDKLLTHDQALINFSFSIVSHGQGEMIRNLLSDFQFANLKNYEILITLNLPENESYLDAHSALPFTIIRNTVKKGFGHNHNDAFKRSIGNVFIILNPDIRFKDQDFNHLWLCLQQTKVGACAPLVLSPSGELEDSARLFPSLLTIVKRYISGIKASTRDYDSIRGAMAVDWTAGMFIAFHRETFQLVNGFDQSYFMYYEDVDICMRLKFAGYKTMVVPQVEVIHDAQRTSRKNIKYLAWHFISALRFTAKYLFLKIRNRDQRIF